MNTTHTMMTDEAMADLYARKMDRQVYACDARASYKQRLSKVTWVLGEKPMPHLLWCDKRKGR